MKNNPRFWSYFDKDNSGFISTGELQQAFSKMGRDFTKDEVKKMVNAADKDGNGLISLEEFAALLN